MTYRSSVEANRGSRHGHAASFRTPHHVRAYPRSPELRSGDGRSHLEGEAEPWNASWREGIERRTGYRIVNIDGRTYSAATIAWAHYYGTWPERYLVFQNKDNADLKIANLGYKFPEPTAEVIAERKLRKKLVHREWRKTRPEVYRASDLKRNFGLTMEQFEEMKTAQGGVCAICGKPETAKRNGKTRWLAVDHDHTTGAVRGLLCGRCNPMIGYANDSPELLRAAIAYLRHHGEAPAAQPALSPSVHDAAVPCGTHTTQ